MISPHKCIAFCISLTLSVTVIVEADNNDHGDALAILLAAGLITALLKSGVSKRHNHFGRHGSNLILPLNHVLGIENFVNHHGLDRLGLQNYGFNPRFASFRNNLGGVDDFPLPPVTLDPSFDGDFFRKKDFKPRGIYPPLPDMINDKRNRFDEDFDPVQKIIQREQEQNPPVLGRNANNPPLKSKDRDFFGFDSKEKPSVRRKEIL